MWFEGQGVHSAALAGHDVDERLGLVRNQLASFLEHRFVCRVAREGDALRLDVRLRDLLFMRPMPVDAWLLVDGSALDVRRVGQRCVVSYRLRADRWWAFQVASVALVTAVAAGLDLPAAAVAGVGAVEIALAAANLAFVKRQFRATALGVLESCRARAT